MLPLRLAIREKNNGAKLATREKDRVIRLAIRTKSKGVEGLNY